jgi:hypothetical protein
MKEKKMEKSTKDKSMVKGKNMMKMEKKGKARKEMNKWNKISKREDKMYDLFINK